MAIINFTLSTNTVVESSEISIELLQVVIQGISGNIILRNIFPVDTQGISGNVILRNIYPIDEQGISGSINVPPPTYNYYRIAATAYNIEPPEEPS